MSDEVMPANYARQVGERLRNVRRQQRLSLQAVEERSEQEFKASVLGAYERGERAISVPRLQRLARLYGVPVDQLLPRDLGPDPARWDRGADRRPSVTADESVSIDLTRLESLDAPEREMISRYLGMIQLQRGDFNGQVLTIRHEDVRAIARLFERDHQDMARRFDELGIRR